jgi:hypothetical protein
MSASRVTEYNREDGRAVVGGEGSGQGLTTSRVTRTVEEDMLDGVLGRHRGLRARRMSAEWWGGLVLESQRVFLCEGATGTKAGAGGQDASRIEVEVMRAVGKRFAVEEGGMGLVGIKLRVPPLVVS